MVAANSATDKPSMLCIAGFGDNASMYDGLRDTELADLFRILPLDLPGFGRPAASGRTTLQSLADFVVEQAKASNAELIVAHSVASIIASLATTRADSPLHTVVSLEGNLTAEDAYFSGSAGDFSEPQAFREAFLERLGQLAASTPEVARYREQVAQADPKALWELGCNARSFSESQHPGELLASAPAAVYLYNPDNLSKPSQAWLASRGLPRLVLDHATHWKSVDQPALLAGKIVEGLRLAA
ncbi:MAG: alpha/beta hydrolase [Pseudomonadota bacterium]